MMGREKMCLNTNELGHTSELDMSGSCPVQNRRRDDRAVVMDNLYVIIDTSPQTLGQVVEISSTGMAFTFVDLDEVSSRLADQTAFKLDIFAGGKGFYVKDVGCKLISKIENASDVHLSSLAIKRVGIKFESLTIMQQVQINQLVRKHHTKAE